MGVIRITKIFTFEMAHILWNYDGACKNIHGHSYKLEVTIKGKPSTAESPKKGMVMDFSDLKNIVQKNIIDVFDHALTAGNDGPADAENQLRKITEKIVILPYPATSENLLIHFSNILNPFFTEDIRLHSLKLYETSTCFAEWYADDNID